jgi:glycosyltransferase involved in cell wall biosynthesis
MDMKTRSPLRAVIFTPLGLGKPGGIDRLMSELDRELKSEQHAMVSACFIVTRGYGSKILLPFFFMSALLHFVVLALLVRVDVVHLNLTKSGSTYRKIIFARACRFFRIPYVVHLHSGIYDKFWDSCKAVVKNEINEMFLNSRKIIVTGNYWKKVIVNRSPDCEEKIVVIPSATRSIVYERPKSTEAVNILFLGMLAPQKGIPQLISALSRLPKSFPWTATLAGDGAVAQTRSAIDLADLGSRVSVPGWVGGQKLDALLRSATIFVLPSFSENLPVSVIEAFAYGIAVICTPVGALPEIVEPERTGLFVQPGDVSGLAGALRRLAEDTELRQRLGHNAKAEQMKRMEIGSYVEQIVAIWNDAVCKS